MTDDKSLPKDVRKRLQIEHAHKMSHDASLIKLADKISNLHDVAANPPVEWSLGRRIEYFDWAQAVVDRPPLVSPKLLELFNAAYAARPRCDV